MLFLQGDMMESSTEIPKDELLEKIRTLEDENKILKEENTESTKKLRNLETKELKQNVFPYLRPKSAGTSPHFEVSHFTMGLLKLWVRSQFSARAIIW